MTDPRNTQWLLLGILLLQGMAQAQSGRSLILPRQAPPIDSTSDQIVILDGLYGQDEQQCRALDKLASRCDGNSSCTIEANDNLCGDPYRNVEKQLFVAYRCGNEAARRTVSIAEGNSTSIFCQQGSDKPLQNRGLIVREARYGSGARLCDASARLASECDGQAECRVRIDNSLCGDPAKGDQKQITIRYDCQGKELNVTVRERSTAVLSCP